MRKKWHVQTPDARSIDDLSASLSCNPVVAAILVNRGIVQKSEARCFLNPSLDDLRPPFAIKDVDRAVERIAAAILNKERVLIFGDYDVDGVTATVLLYGFLRSIGASVTYYIPHRVTEGYGLRERHVHDVAASNGSTLIVTADCGTSGHDAVSAANRLNIDVIVTDHHNVTDILPEALAVVNPKRRDCNAGFEHLAGVGVVFFVIICLRKYLREMKFWLDRPEPNLKQLSDLVALGTVADQVPLIRENRILTKIGLDQLGSPHRPGILALTKICGINAVTDTEDIAFRLAPRLNASGRLDHANQAVELLMTGDVETAVRISEDLNRLNIERQNTEKQILAEIERHFIRHPECLEKHSVVLASPSWHVGVLGIVASRLVEKLHRPVVLISVQNEIGKGSARSIPEIDLFHAIRSCEASLEAYGGHAMAAGLSVRDENIDRFRNDFETVVEQHRRNGGDEPTLMIDYEIRFEQITPRLLDALEPLKPFGAGNPEPVFKARGIEVAFQKIVGGSHRQMLLRQNSDATGKRVRTIHFNIDPKETPPRRFDEIVFRLRWNRWNGNKTVQIVIEDL